MPEWLEDDTLFDRAIGVAVARDAHFPKAFGPSTIQSHLTEASTPDVVPSLHRYEFIEIIGQGGIGTVWRARDRDLDRDVAIKVLRREFEISSSAIERFISEARIAGRLQHAGIPPVYEIGTFPDRRVYLVMKLIRGQTLSAILRSQPLDETRRLQYLQYFTSLCQTVAFAHASGVIHCDLKPNNVMVGEFGEVHVMDWGLALETANPAANETARACQASRLNDSPTPEGAPGTRGYMAPELIHSTGLEIDERVDVYSLGMMVFELMTGKPFLGDVNNAQSIADWDAAINRPGLLAMARACLSPDRAQRPASAADLVRTLNDYQIHLQTRLREVELAHAAAEVRANERQRRRRLWALVGLTAILAIGAVVAVRFRQVADQRQRDRELQQQVTLYLDEANGELQSGRRLRAEASLRKAEGLAVAAPAIVRETVRERLDDLRLLEQLETIRFLHSRMQELPYPAGFSRISQAGVAFDREAPHYYARAFQRYGIDLDVLSEDDAVRAIRAKPIREALIRALDEWAMNAGTASERNRLNRIANGAEEPANGMARRIRAAFATRQSDDLQSLAKNLSDRDAPESYFAVGHALRKRGLHDAALRVLTEARRQSPRDFWINLELGTVQALVKPNDPALAKPWIESAFALSDGNADVYTYLGIAQAGASLFSDSEVSFRHALSLNPNLSGGTLRLAYVLTAQKKYADALSVVDATIAAEPEHPLARFNRGVILQVQKGNIAEIEEAFRRAVALDPKYAEAWNNLGNVLTGRRKYEEADAAFQNAQAAKPGYARAAFNQAVLCDLQNQFDRAIPLYREAIASDEEYAEAYYNLAHDLAYHKGRFAEAIPLLERGLRTVPETEPSRPKWPRLIEACRKWSRSDQRLQELLKAGAEPASPLEATDLAVLAAWPHRQDFRTAVTYFQFAFDRNPAMAADLVQGYRYFAAGCAARVSSDRSMRDRAYTWLSADLAVREKQLASNDAALKQDVKGKLRYWLGDPNLAAIRDTATIQAFGEEEKQQWTAFWSKIRDLQK